MMAFSQLSVEKYRIFLSSSFNDMKDIRKLMLKRFVNAGLFVYAMEQLSANTGPLSEKMEKEIDNSDIFILLVKETLGRTTIGSMPATQYEYEYAVRRNKPILAYFSDNGNYGEFTSEEEFKKKVLQNRKYCPITNDNHKTVSIILADIIYLINLKDNITFWVKSDLSLADIKNIKSEKEQMERNINRLSILIRDCENKIKDEHKRNQLVGPMIEAGLRPNISGQAIKYSNPVTPNGELRIEDIQFEYFVDRYEKYNVFTYDKKLKLFWCFIKDRNFNYEEAKRFANEFSLEIQGDNRIQWRLPTIDELITMVTDKPIDGKHLEKCVVEDDVYWYWSSTLNAKRDKAYYLEASSGQILKDYIGIVGEGYHRKCLLLCSEAIFDAAENIPIKQIYNSDDIDTPCDIENLEQSIRIYGVYLTSLAAGNIDADTIENIRVGLSVFNTTLTTFETMSSRSGSVDEIIKTELKQNDCYIITLNYSSPSILSEPIKKRVNLELEIAREIGKPVIVIHNLSSTEQRKEILKSIKLTDTEFENSIFLTNYNDVRMTICTTIDRLENKSGWIQNCLFASINRYISENNRRAELISEHYKEIKSFVNEVKYHNNLDPVLKKVGVFLSKPLFGKHRRFVSVDNPTSRLSQGPDERANEHYPVIFINIENRFSMISEDKNIVYDDYLKLKWWLRPKKKTTYLEAEEYSTRIAESEGENWKIPTISQLMTLLTPFRGERKYMDEEVFGTAIGRWFWSSTTNQKKVYYLDANYFYDAIRLEDTPVEQEYKRKSVILVAPVTIENDT